MQGGAIVEVSAGKYSIFSLFNQENSAKGGRHSRIRGSVARKAARSKVASSN